MTLIAKNLATLTGGVSQQAASLRLANQCEEQVNFRASLVNGLQSRRGRKQICTVAADKGAFYAIDRDDDGRYNLIVNSSGLTITDDEGNAQSVSYETGAQSYLTADGEGGVSVTAEADSIGREVTYRREETANRTPWRNPRRGNGETGTVPLVVHTAGTAHRGGGYRAHQTQLTT